MLLCDSIGATIIRRPPFGWMVMTLLLPTVVSQAQDTPPGGNYTIQMRPLGSVPAKAKIRKEVVTRDGRNVVWRVTLANGEAYVLNGQPDPPVPVLKSAPFVSPDGSRLAYKIDAAAGAKRAVVVEGKTGPVLDQVNNDTIVFSHDSKHLAYSGDKEGAAALVVDQQLVGTGLNVKSDSLFSPDFSRSAVKVGVEGDRRAVRVDGVTGPAFAQIDNGTLAFSRDGRRLVYVAMEGEGKSAKARVVLDGTPGEPFDSARALIFSPDSSHLAYIAVSAGKEHVVLDGKPGPECDAIDPYFLRFTPTGQLGYRAERGSKMAFILDGKVQCESPGILDWSVGAGGQGVAVITRSGAAWSVVFEGTQGKPFTEISAPAVVSPDGAHFACAAQNGRQAVVVKDGVTGAAWDLVSQGPAFSSNGSHWGYAAQRDGNWFVVVDGQEHGPYAWFAWGSLQFSPDGTHWAFLVQKQEQKQDQKLNQKQEPKLARWLVVLDGKPIVECDAVASTPARFSTDSRHFACMVRQGAKWRLVVDGEPGPLFDRLFDITPEFAPDDSLTYPAIRDETLYRVTHTLAQHR